MRDYARLLFSSGCQKFVRFRLELVFIEFVRRFSETCFTHFFENKEKFHKL